MPMPSPRFTLRIAMALVALVAIGLAAAIWAPRWAADARRSRAAAEALERPMDMPFNDPTPPHEVLNYIAVATTGPDLPEGLPIYVDSATLFRWRDSPSGVRLASSGKPLRASLRAILDQMGSGSDFVLSDGRLLIMRRPSTEWDRSSGARSEDLPPRPAAR
jgi:hypothetical protein